MKKQVMVCLAVLVVLSLLATPALAVLVGPSWGVPGDYTFATSDTTNKAIGLAGGLTWTYSGFDTSKFVQLVWAPAWTGGYDPTGLAYDGNINDVGAYTGLARNESAISLTPSGNAASGSGTTEIRNASLVTSAVSVGWTMSIYDLSNNPIGFSTDASFGFNEVGVAADVTTAILNTGGFYVNILATGGSGTPFYTYYDNYQTPPGEQAARLSFNDGFYHAVPIPGAVWLFGSALLGFAGFRKRFKKA